MSAILVLVLRILLVVALYGFLGWALWMLLRDLRAHGQMLTAPHIPTLVIIPVSGGGESEDGRATEDGRMYEDNTTDNGQSNGRHEFSKPEIIIGRSSRCDLCFADDTVSARHARLSFHHNQWWIEDLRSRNGTFLNDERVSVPTVLTNGDELRCGQVASLIEIQ
jgi:hypothetical protein